MLLHLIYFSGISMFFALLCLSVSEARPPSVSVAVVCPSVSQALPLLQTFPFHGVQDREGEEEGGRGGRNRREEEG